ncbi:MAG: hypothetical protein ACK5N7_08905 [Curvibacter sp.]|jgi:hypothetical protein
MSRFELSVDRTSFAKALKTATTGIRGKSPFKIRLHFAEGLLFVSGPGAGAEIDAEGNWPGAVLIDGVAVKALASRLPDPQPFLLIVEERRLKIGGFSMSVEAMDIAPQQTTFVLGAGSHPILLGIERHGEPAVLASIGETAVEKARREARQAVDMAFSHLRDYGVRREEVELCLEESIRRQVAARSDEA